MNVDIAQPPVLRAAALGLIGLAMIGEAVRSRRNTRALKLDGAMEPADPVWPVMAAAYPAAFGAMFVESAMRGGPTPGQFGLGLLLWQLSKALKYWAMRALGTRWSFRVLVLPGEPLVAEGPYRWLRHPNYVAVAGELIGAGVMMAAPIAGVVFTLAFAEIMRRRIQVEERALGIRRA